MRPHTLHSARLPAGATAGTAAATTSAMAACRPRRSSLQQPRCAIAAHAALLPCRASSVAPSAAAHACGHGRTTAAATPASPLQAHQTAAGATSAAAYAQSGAMGASRLPARAASNPAITIQHLLSIPASSPAPETAAQQARAQLMAGPPRTCSGNSSGSTSSGSSVVGVDLLDIPAPEISPEEIPALLSWCEPDVMPEATQFIVEQHLSPACSSCILEAARLAGCFDKAVTTSAREAGPCTINAYHLLSGVVGNTAASARQPGEGEAATAAAGKCDKAADGTVEALLQLLQLHGCSADDLQQAAAICAARTVQGAKGQNRGVFAPCAQHFLLQAFRWAMKTGTRPAIPYLLSVGAFPSWTLTECLRHGLYLVWRVCAVHRLTP